MIRFKQKHPGSYEVQVFFQVFIQRSMSRIVSYCIPTKGFESKFS